VIDRFIRLLWSVVAVLIAVGAAWFVADRWTQDDIAAARRALDARAGELTLRALAAGSPLACLDGVANTTVEAACEKALFASPETIASAIAYADARIGLLADATAHVARDPGYAGTLERLRRGLEADRFGFVAQALATHGCTAEDCPGLRLLRDPTRVVANLRERTFDANVVLHAAAWRPENATVAASPPPAVLPDAQAAAPSVPTGVPVSSKYDFPSAASIPAVSIMNAEPAPKDEPAATAAAPTPAAAAAPPPARPPPARRQSSSQQLPPREPPVGQPTQIVPLPPAGPGAAR
jgi:hypothetical protein